MIGFFDQSLEKIRSLPGIETAAVIASPPFINLESGRVVHSCGPARAAAGK